MVLRRLARKGVHFRPLAFLRGSGERQEVGISGKGRPAELVSLLVVWRENIKSI